MREPKCKWCDRLVADKDAQVVGGRIMHPKCIDQERQHLVAGVAVVHEFTVDYVSVDAATSNDASFNQNSTRPDTFEGFMARFETRHKGKPTEKMRAMLREAYKAGAVDGARFVAKVVARN